MCGNLGEKGGRSQGIRQEEREMDGTGRGQN